MSERNLRELRVAMKKSYGLILCVGPTGSGKTTTLHAVLAELNEPDTKIWTAEDPVEITQFGLRQVQVNPKIGYTFEGAMRSFLRADPDIIMVGEMRDAQTAGIAVEASLTGHLVMSTLHTNSAPETVTRLLDMGLEPFSFADALVGVLAQRLARTLCPACKRQQAPTEAEFATLVNAYGKELWDQNIGIADPSGTEMYGPKGCSKCDMSGYKGRAALHELLIADDEMRALVAARAPMQKIRSVAIKGGMTTLIQDGIQKVLGGVTDMKQVLAVCAK
jgi:type II secretory ATPase GspE/PulE/Tfp pilus assembly ATPase PilB-like protein